MVKKKLIAFLLLLVFVSQTTGLNSIALALDNKAETFLIGLKEDSDLDAFMQNKGLSSSKHKKAKYSNVLIADLTLAEIADIKNDDEVAFIEQDAFVEVASVGQIDKNHIDVKDLEDKTQVIPWGIKEIGADKALENKLDGRKIKIAVLDTGISKHEDIKVAGGISFVEGVTDYDDDHGHGTHVAGTIAASDNQIGVVGVAPESDIYAVKVIDKTGFGTYSQVIQGIEWAIENDVDIISMSFAGFTDSQALHEVIKIANSKGILIIAAAGNMGTEEHTFLYPAKYAEVLSVGAVDRNLKRAEFSSAGAELDLVAPGVEILSTTSDGGYGVLSGTSMATPHVVGAAATLLASNKAMTNDEIKQKLYDTATPLGATEEYGHGLVNLSKALGLEAEPNAPSQDDATSSQPDSTSINGSKLPFKFSSTLGKDENIITKFWLLSADSSYENIDLSIHKEGNKEPVYAKTLENITDAVLINGLEPDREYKFNVRIKKLDNVTESYNGLLIVNTKKLNKAKKYNQVKAQVRAVDKNTTSLNILDFLNSGLLSIMTGTRYESESNNSYSSANTIYDDDDVYGTISSLSDIDYFKVQFSSNGNANFWLGSIPAGADYDLFLYDSNGTTLLSYSYNGGDDDELISQYPVTAGKWYYIRVDSYDGYNTSAYYHLRAKNYPTSGSGDRYEPNDSMASATSIGSNTTFSDANIHTTSDLDYFKFTLSTRSNVTVGMSNIPSGTDYDMALYNSSSALIGSSTAGSSNPESIAQTLDAGTYYIKVYSWSGSSSSYYTLQVTSSSVPSGDRYEPNDSMTSATSIGSNTTFSDANIHVSTDEDYFKFTISERSNVTVGMSNIPSGTDYDLRLYDSAGAVLNASGYPYNDPESMSNTLDAGTYYIKVLSSSGASSSYYTLQVTSTSIPSSDRYEPNDSMDSATSIGNNTTFSDANIHVSTDIDYFKFTLSAPSNVTVGLSNIPSSTDYDLRLYDSAGAVLNASGYPYNDPESMSNTLDAGTYYIKVFSSSGASSSYYTLQVNSAATATTIVESISVESDHPYPDDYYDKWTIAKEDATRIRVHFEYIDTESYFDYVRTSAGDEWTGYNTDVWSSWSIGSSIDVLLDTDGSITMNGFVIDKIEYEPVYSAAEAGIYDGIDDEPNNSMSQAEPIAFRGGGQEKVAGAAGYIGYNGDEDWYKIYLIAGFNSVTLTNANTSSHTNILGTLPADYNVYVYDSSGNSVAASLNVGTAKEQAHFIVPSGWYYIRVDGSGSAYSTSTKYKMMLTKGDTPFYMEGQRYRLFPHAFYGRQRASSGAAYGTEHHNIGVAYGYGSKDSLSEYESKMTQADAHIATPFDNWNDYSSSYPRPGRKDGETGQWAGIDCSGLIWRAAKASNISYAIENYQGNGDNSIYYVDTNVIYNNSNLITTDLNAEIGDVFVRPKSGNACGHVVFISRLGSQRKYFKIIHAYASTYSRVVQETSMAPIGSTFSLRALHQ